MGCGSSAANSRHDNCSMGVRIWEEELFVEDDAFTGVAVVLSIASGSLSIVSYYNSDAPSCFKLLEGETQYENGRCVHTTNVTYVEQTIALKGAPITVMRHDDRFGYVEGKEYTVTAGVFDGKEYKDGDTIFVTNQNGKYGVVSDRREDTISDAIGFVNSVTGGASVEKCV